MTDHQKRGPKPKYRPEMCQQIIEVAENGGHIPQMCLVIGLNSKTTFHEWVKTYPDFADAYSQSKLVSQAFYENMALRGAAGLIPGFNVTSLAMIMNNKFPDEYKRGANGGSTSHETTINVVNLSPDELRYKIAQKQELLRQKGQFIESQPIDAEFETE